MKSVFVKIRFLTGVFILLIYAGTIRASVVTYQKEHDGVSFTLDHGLMKVKICFNNMVQVKYTILPLFLDKSSLVITNEWISIPDFTVNELPGEIVITTSRLKVIVDRKTNSIRYTDLSGNTILSEDATHGKK